MTRFWNCGIKVLFIILLNQGFQCTGQTPSGVELSPPNTTTVSTTANGTSPQVPNETTPNPDTVNKYTVTNGTGVVCVVMLADIVFHIKYNDTDYTPQTANITIPEHYNTSGNCSFNNDQQQRLDITFFNNTWTLTLLIKRDTENAASVGEVTVIPYFWTEVDFTYIITEELFPDVLPRMIGAKVSTSSFYPAGRFHTYGQSYRCNGTTTINVGPEMDISQFQYRAFGTTNDDGFLDTGVTECEESPEPAPSKLFDETAIIVIGAVCCGVVVVALIIYIIFRQRQHKNYDQM